MKKLQEKMLFTVLFMITIALFSQMLIAQGSKTINKESKKAKTEKIEQNDYPINEIIATVGDEKITYGDLEKAFKKNMNRKEVNLYEVSKDSINDFLNLYVNYRLKVKDAIDRGFDKDSSVLADIEQNRKILAESYYYEKKLMNPWLDKNIQLRDRELKIAIIAFQFPGAGTNDTMETYQRAMNTLRLIESGYKFEIVAKDSSDDKESAKLGGIIPYYITIGNVQRPIEDVIFKLAPGEYSKAPIRTKYGYFLVKVVKSDPRIQVWASHILFSLSMNRDTVAVKKKADSVLALIRAGKDFKKLAMENSDDKSSSQRGGELGGYYCRSSGFQNTGNHLIGEFEDALFALKDGEYSDLILTPYGYHVILRDSTRNFDPEKERNDLRAIYKKIYYEFDKEAFLDSLYKQFGFEINEETTNFLLSVVDTNKTTLDSAWAKNIDDNLYSKTLYKFMNKNTSVKEFVNKLNTVQELRGASLNKEGLKRAIDKIITPLVFKEATKNLENEYPDFAQLMKEFRDGILLFKVEAMEVWDKLKFDSALAEKYYDSTKYRYYTEPMYDLSEIYVLNDTLANEIYEKIRSGIDFDTLAKTYTQRAGFREKFGYWGEVSIKDNSLAKIVKEQENTREAGSKEIIGTVLKPVPYEKGFSVIRVNSFNPSRQKTFQEAISDFAPEFQDLMQKKLTEKWLENVREKFKVSINNAKLDEIIKKLKK